MPLAAISFTSPMLLWGALFALLPFVAHLLNRRSRKNVIFPTIRFLQQSSAAQSRLFRFRRLILFALRCAAVVFVAVAFTRPVWFESPSLQADATRATGVVVVLDTSLSTQQQTDGQPLFESLRSRVSTILEELQPGRDVANIVIASERPAGLFPRLTPNLPALRENLRTLTAGYARTDWPRSLAVAGELLANHNGPRRVVVVSDLQKSNWSELEESSENWLPWGTQLTFVVPEVPAPSNLSLSLPRSSPPRPLLRQDSQVVVRVTNGSDVTQEVPVSMKSAGVAASTVTIRIAPGEEREVGFPVVWNESRREVVELEIPDDGLRADNQAVLVVEPAARLPVLIVSSGDASVPGGGLYFLTRALAPLGSTSDAYDVRIVPPAVLRRSDLTAAGLVFLEDLTSLPKEAAVILAGHIQSGGSLVVLAGLPGMEKVLESLSAAGGSTGLLPFLPGGLRDLSALREPTTISGGKWRSRLLQEFDEQSQLALGQIRFHRVQSARVIHPEAELLLSFSNGSPAVAMRQIGNGRLVVVTFSADVSSSDIGKFGSFVALMQAFARELRPSISGETPPIIGQFWQSLDPLKLSGEGGAIQLVDPIGGRTPAQLVEREENRYLQIERLALPGLYRFETDGQWLQSVIVSTDPRESRLERLRADSVQALMARRNQPSTLLSLSEPGAQRRAGRSLWPWVAGAALGFLTIEMLSLLCWRR